MTAKIHGPTSHTYYSQRLRLHYVDWGNPDAPPLLLIHGGRDHCRNWDWIAQELRNDYHIIAPDLRGHGDSQWLLGGSYNSVDFVYDITQLLIQTKLTPIKILSHSMGGGVALQYAGIYPENVSKLIAIEGIGPPPQMLEMFAKQPIHERLREWHQSLRKMSARAPRKYPTAEDAFQRMHEENKHLSKEQAYHLTVHGADQNEDGTYSWKFDNYVRAFPPFGLNSDDIEKLWSRIICPTLLVNGTESWASDPAEDGRIKHFKNARSVAIEKAGHWVHHDQLDEFLALAKDFLSD